MGVNGAKSSSSLPRRAYYPSGPWVDGVRPAESVAAVETEKEKNARIAFSGPRKLPNPDPANYKIVKATERDGFLIIKLHYPDCTNFEGQKILLFRGVTLIDLVNQKFIDPHFFKDKKYASPIARFVPDDEGWEMAEKLVTALIVPSKP